MDRDLDLVSDIIREAGAIVLKHYEAGAIADADKDGEPVTIADRESDAFIVGALRRAFPDDEIVSEESFSDLVKPPRQAADDAAAQSPEGRVGDAPAERGDAPAFILEHTPDAEPPSVEHAPPRVWYVDPMDGTSDFVKRTDDFVVMIGLAVAGWPVLGAVYHPPSGTLYRGGHGIVAEAIVGDERTELRVSEVADPHRARLVVSRSHTPDVVADMAARLGIEKMEKCGSVGLKAARVAAGVGELYLHPSIGTKLWDTCAPEAIVVAAGGTFSDCDGKPLVYDAARIHNERGVFASNGRLHDAVLEQISGVW
jgi:3'(2'), 5'-bisphosphate nucleotidase